ncbi:MAG: hypothetical protein ACR2O0_10965, partial [Rhizobiaceae bacterium]
MNSSQANPGAQTGLDTGRQIFGKRSNQSTITIERHGKCRRYNFSALGVSVLFSVFAMFFVGYFTATAYLVLRDDLIGMTHARNARLLHEYEDRIAELRANLDRITSRQLLDQQAIEAKVAELIKRQDMLGGQSSKVTELLDKAAIHGLHKPNKKTEKSNGAKQAKEASIIPNIEAGEQRMQVKSAQMMNFQLRGAAGEADMPADSLLAVNNSDLDTDIIT